MVLYEIWSIGQKPFNNLTNPIVRSSRAYEGTLNRCIRTFPYTILVDNRHSDCFHVSVKRLEIEVDAHFCR